MFSVSGHVICLITMVFGRFNDMVLLQSNILTLVLEQILVHKWSFINLVGAYLESVSILLVLGTLGGFVFSASYG